MSAPAPLISRHHPQFETRFREAFEVAKTESARLVGPSLMERFCRLSREHREAIWAELDTIEKVRLLYAWEAWARPKQLPKTLRRIILALGGRGSGKSKTASNWLRKRIEQGARTLFIAGPSLADIEKYQIYGESGLVSAFPPHQRPIHHEKKRLITWPHLPGVECHIITAEEPEWRGANIDTGWWDEIAKSRYRDRLWNNIEMSARSAESGLDVQIMVTTTPLPVALLKELVLDPDCLTILSSSTENASNLEGRTLKRWQARFGGTRLGRQEMDGEILSDNPGALFSKTKIEEERKTEFPPCVEIAIAIDPSAGILMTNDPTAMVAGGIDARGHIYIKASIAGRWTPEQWGSKSVLFADEHKADATVVETNRDSDITAANVRNAYRVLGRRVPVPDKVTGRGGIQSAFARAAKEVRADPVQALMEQGRIHFVGTHPELESEITEWDPSLGGKSPNLLDAFVWLCWYLARLGDPESEDFEEAADGIEEANAWLDRQAVPRGSRGVEAIEVEEDDDDGYEGSSWDGRI